MRCCRTAKGPCGLALCPVRKGTPALGQPKAQPSKRGRDEREKAYALAHPRCEYPGCTVLATATHHVEKRGLGGWNRAKSPLQSLCGMHHEAVHRGVPV